MTLLVSLPPRLEAFVRQEVDAGHFQSMEDVIRSALRLMEVIRQDRRLKLAWRRQESQRGLDGGPVAPLTTGEITGRGRADG
jgi:putative addiction module CopG family antidote